ncbi:MAG: gamma carbonic anhydrase family protein [Deltaproteobacteria bacterium]|nr:gamma carbonic anhydrase family protein [Deltaproteobacteria bacterium]
MIHAFENLLPNIHSDSFVHPDATLIGDVEIGEGSSIWPGTILRADMGKIRIGKQTSIQDGSCVHLTQHLSDTMVGDRVTVGHRVILHGCIVEDECLIGMGAIVLDNARIGKGSLVGAGALVTSGTEIPPGSLVLGSPAKVVRPVKEREREMIKNGWETYVSFSKRMKEACKTAL